MESLIFDIRPELSHLGVLIWNMLYPFEANSSLLTTYNGKTLAEMAVWDGDISTIEHELFDAYSARNIPEIPRDFLQYNGVVFLKIAAQEKVEFERSCLYLSNEVFGVEDSSHLDSISISYQPDKNEAIYYQKVLMTPKAVTAYLENYKDYDTNLPLGYISPELHYTIVADCSKKTISKFVEDVYRPTFNWTPNTLKEHLQRTNHKLSFSCDGFHR